MFQDVAEGTANQLHQHELRGPSWEVRAADGHRQRKPRDGRAADRTPCRDQRRPPARHLRRVRRSCGSPSGARGNHQQAGPTEGTNLLGISFKLPTDEAMLECNLKLFDNFQVKFLGQQNQIGNIADRLYSCLYNVDR